MTQFEQSPSENLNAFSLSSWDAAFLDNSIQPGLLLFQTMFLGATIIAGVYSSVLIRRHGLRKFHNPLEDDDVISVLLAGGCIAFAIGIFALFAELETVLMLCMMAMAAGAAVYLQFSYIGWIASRWSCLGRDPGSHNFLCVALSALVIGIWTASGFLDETKRLISICSASGLILTLLFIYTAIRFRPGRNKQTRI